MVYIGLFFTILPLPPHKAFVYLFSCIKNGGLRSPNFYFSTLIHFHVSSVKSNNVMEHGLNG